MHQTSIGMRSKQFENYFLYLHVAAGNYTFEIKRKFHTFGVRFIFSSALVIAGTLRWDSG